MFHPQDQFTKKAVIGTQAHRARKMEGLISAGVASAWKRNVRPDRRGTARTAGQRVCRQNIPAIGTEMCLLNRHGAGAGKTGGRVQELEQALCELPAGAA